MALAGFVTAEGSTTRQQEQLGSLINACVEVPGVRENAVSTCFLEHAEQIGMAKQLRPFLSPAARQRLRA